jgi:HK97 family phage major capsid protein
MRTYESTMAEVEALEAEQRAIIDKGTPGDSDSQALLQAQGEIQALRRVAEDLHKAEVAELKAAAERATIITPDKDSQNKQAMRDFRNMLKSMRPGEEVTLVSDALAAGSGSGSYLVPQEWHDKVEEYRFESNFMRQDGAMVVKTESTHNIPVLSALGTAAITGENLAYTNSEPTVSQVILSAYKLTNSALVSEELLEDSAYDVEGLLARAFGLGFGQGELGYAMTGNGSAQPTGIFNKTADLTTDTAGRHDQRRGSSRPSIRWLLSTGIPGASG